MFNPSQADVRRFLCAVHAKTLSGAPMEAIETLASLWIAEHPEYHAELANADAAVARNYDETPDRTNPFLHLSMHLSISEQCSIDQPRGIRQAVELLTRRRGDLLALIGTVPDDAVSLLLVGHNPGMEEVAARLAGAGDPESLRAIREKFPTSAVAEIAWDGPWGAPVATRVTGFAIARG